LALLGTVVRPDVVSKSHALRLSSSKETTNEKEDREKWTKKCQKRVSEHFHWNMPRLKVSKRFAKNFLLENAWIAYFHLYIVKMIFS